MNMISLPSDCLAAGASRYSRRYTALRLLAAFGFGFALASALRAAPPPALRPIVGDAGREQRIDGFGTCTYAGDAPEQAWFQELYFGELRASILRADLTPRYKSPYSDWTYNSPWFHNNPPLPGPENNNVRTYTGPSDYSREFAGKRAPIAVMGPDIETNIAVFDYENELPHGSGTLAHAGTQRAAELGGFKLLGCFWSPAPWVKIASGNVSPNYGGILPTGGTPWPYIWADNFAGGKLDISNTPLEVFNDGTGPTSALTQYARSCAAYILGYQRYFGVKFHAISLQNEPGFEQFYNSAKYQLSSEYIAALKALRAEFDRHAELRQIVFSGTDDLLGEDAYGLWQYGGGSSIQHKNLQFVANIEADPQARAALQIYSIHGYAANGVSAANADPVQWSWWADGWTESPAPGVPAPVAGFAATGKKSWMTETSGEDPRWLWPESGFPGSGAWSVALRIHQALTAGRESAWLYWQMADGDTASHSGALTGSEELGAAPKFNAAKHFFRYIRPGAQRVDVTVDDPAIAASAYVHDGNQTITYVLLNTSGTPVTLAVAAPPLPSGIRSFDVFTSSNDSLWVPTTAPVVKHQANVTVPGYGVVTVVGQGTSRSVFADAPSAGWSIEAGGTTAELAHWQSDGALALAPERRDATLRLVAPGGATLGENDLLEFYVRAPDARAVLDKIEFQFAGSKHSVSAKHHDLYVDDRPLRGRKVDVPNDEAWHKVTVDLDGLQPRRGAKLTGIEIEADGRRRVLVDDVVLRSL